jgi:integration host factor subunit beta
MIRSELISNLAEKHPQFTASDVDLAVKTIIDSIVNHLAQGDRVEIRGFASFSVRTRPPRLGLNPRTGEKIHVPEKRVLNFRPGTELRERVNVQEVKQRDRLKETA